jgi:hypothetical protein
MHRAKRGTARLPSYATTYLHTPPFIRFKTTKDPRSYSLMTLVASVVIVVLGVKE